MKNGTKILVLVVIVAVIIIMQGKKEGTSPYKCFSDVGGAKAAYLPPPYPTEPGPYGTIWVTDYYGDEVHRKTDYCLSSWTVRQYWCELNCFNKECWAVDSNTFFSVDFSCNGGCSSGICTVVYDYAYFMSTKDSYLSGGDFITFISDANRWVM